MGSREINEYLTYLAVERHVSASTQSQALAAILFLYRGVLGEEVPWLTDLVRAPRKGACAGGAHPCGYCCAASGAPRASDPGVSAVPSPPPRFPRSRNGFKPS